MSMNVDDSEFPWTGERYGVTSNDVVGGMFILDDGSLFILPLDDSLGGRMSPETAVELAKAILGRASHPDREANTP